MTRARTTTATVLGLAVPVLLIASLWLWEWRYAATAAVVGATALALGTIPQTRPQGREECGTPAPFTAGGEATPRRCALDAGHTGGHRDAKRHYGWGEFERPWPAREEID